MDKIIYTIKLRDGKILNSDKVSWHDYSKMMEIETPKGRKTAFVSNPEVELLKIRINDLEKEVKVLEGKSVYYSIVAENVFSSINPESKTNILGVTIGIVENGRVVEEYFLDNSQGQVIGYKY